MKFLLDVNVGSAIARELASLGHDVQRMAEIEPKAEDPAILAKAADEGRTLVTYDRDFSELIFHQRHNPPPAIIYLRFEPDDIAEAIAKLHPILDFRCFAAT